MNLCFTLAYAFPDLFKSLGIVEKYSIHQVKVVNGIMLFTGKKQTNKKRFNPIKNTQIKQVICICYQFKVSLK